MKERISFKDVPQELMTAMLSMGSYLKTTGLDAKLLELVKYRVSQLNGCAFCLDMHHKDAIHHGETEQRLHSLPAWRNAPGTATQKEQHWLIRIRLRPIPTSTILFLPHWPLFLTKKR